MRTLLCLALLVLPVAAPIAAGIEISEGLSVYELERNGPCLTEAQRQAIWEDLNASIERLREEGRLPESDKTRTVAFDWPLRAANGLDAYGYHAVSGFVDHDPVTSSVLDYNCGNRSYDLPEYDYNHKGTDYFPWPFYWYKMDHDQVEIVSAAPGTIIHKQDGNYDRNCGFGGGDWNAVYVQHSDGSIAWYGHMKNGSVTSLPIGSPVDAGDYLGVIGSSGNSTGPHLHLEVYDGEGQLIDPYAGPCNDMNSESWWLDQRPYYDSAINALMTHSRAPLRPPCPETEVPYTSDVFEPGMPVMMIAYYRDLVAGQVSEWRLHRPDGSIAFEWNHSFSSPPYYVNATVARTYILPEDAPFGTWWVDILYEGEIYAHSFLVVSPASVDDALGDPSLKLARISPNPFSAEAVIDYRIPKAGPARLAIYDSRGRWVVTVIDGHQPAGLRSTTWNGLDAQGNPVPTGVYFARMDSGGLTRYLKFMRAH